VAVTRGRAIGVDLERLDPRVDLAAVADTVFAASERAFLAACAPEARASFFFRTWVRKEAFIKALGLGFARDPRRFSVLEAAAGQPQLATSEDGETTDQWIIEDVDLGPPLAGAAFAALCLERTSD